MNRHVVDTNVLIVASGEHPDSPFASDRHPVEDAEQSEKVLNWLMDFEASVGRMVVDKDWAIIGEYQNKLTDQDYGQRVLFEKMSRSEIDYVDIEWVEDPALPDTEKVARLEASLQPVIHDLADTKMVAACFNANKSGMPCNIVNACDTDWYDWQEALEAEGVIVEQIIEDWSREKWRAHHNR
ncbi:hypothetical protein [Endozoicomonas sp. 8E]|uniref:hypothetical protein n=1 Tax=Endozoicomonas sp. 8E TaxID=3035692 RepID=UPI0029391213|nr:hypothetical protein [Endozoicomonas sp. 8E]WOG27414.1 hypothetical protein P6910_23150 [Endozoicomonas sp. 8E]